MSLIQSPNIVTNGLVFACDMGNGKSNVGGPVSNLLASPSTNGYPTTGNSWGTYNTNQYNSGNYFSIGTISSVSGNIVTTSSAHPLRTYDVMQPQTTGGGVTAGTNYLVKKLSDTTFCLYPYNSSQDGSQGYINPLTGNHKVYDDMESDNKVSINSSSFPTMWWGYPHLPNSGLVKEIITRGFNGIPGRNPTDCVRLHYIRSDGVKDGMSYGADATVTSNSTVTVSFWSKSVDVGAVGQTVQFQIYNYGVTTPSGQYLSFTLGPVGVWQKQTLTFTSNNPYCISYWFGTGSGTYKWDLANIQYEAGSVSSQFASGTRTNTQSIVDLTGNNTLTVNSLTYANDGSFSFNGVNNNIDINNSTLISGTNPYTIDAWYTRVSGTGAIFGNYGTSYTTNTIWVFAGGLYFNGSYYIPNYASRISGTHNICVTKDTFGSINVYFDGNLEVTSTNTTAVSTNQNYRIGADVNGAGEPFNGNIYSVKVYNRALSTSEVLQNFNALRGRYGI